MLKFAKNEYVIFKKSPEHKYWTCVKDNEIVKVVDFDRIRDGYISVNILTKKGISQTVYQNDLHPIKSKELRLDI